MTDAQWTDNARPTAPLSEMNAGPAIHVLADTIDRLRHHCREASRQVIYRGGIRDGADAGKAICCGATAVTIGLAGVAPAKAFIWLACCLRRSRLLDPPQHFL